MPSFTNSQGFPLRLGHKIGAGGEGAVYDVAGQPGIVAKIYHQALTQQRASKIRAMVGIAGQSLGQMTAWPIDLILADGKRPFGLLMPKISGHYDVHNLYSPKSRKTNFPSASFPFLVHAAGNIARAFATVHAAGCVIGDVNHGSVTVSNKATVKLIDCDSFQIQVGGQLYLCEVTVPTFTPPELQGRSVRGVVRTPNHDNFGLAVLVFHLLFMGRHPFAGRFLGRGDMGIETAIQQFRFAYGPNHRLTQMEPPPHVPPLAVASTELASLFESAFGRDGCKNDGRPTSVEWITALDSLGNQLINCRTNPAHAYLKMLTACPWCEVEAATGVQLFNIIILPTTEPDLFDIVTVWRTIQSIKAPSPEPPPKPEDMGPLSPSPEAVKAQATNRAKKLVGPGAAVLAIVGALIASAMAPNYIVLWGFMGWGFYHVTVRNFGLPATAAFKAALSTAEVRYRTTVAKFDNFGRSSPGSHQAFTNKRRQLQTLHQRWNELPARRASRLQMLEAERQQQQLESFLGNFFIDHAKIRDIGPGRKATLASYGIETAADVTRRRVKKVPGFGNEMTSRLLDWRNEVSLRFTFDPTQGIDPVRIADLDREIAKEKRHIERELITGTTELSQLKRQSEQHYIPLRRAVEEAAYAVAQARVDQRAAQGLWRP